MESYLRITWAAMDNLSPKTLRALDTLGKLLGI